MPDRAQLPDQGAREPLNRAKAVKAAVDAVQEEFDERGLGEADLIVQVILDESGYPIEVDRLRADLSTLGAAFAALYSQGLNGVICDPAHASEPVSRHNCGPCSRAWTAGREVLSKYDAKYASLFRFGPMFQPVFAPEFDEEVGSDG